MAHKHYKEMMMYAEDAAETDEPWSRWQGHHDSRDEWKGLYNNPMWLTCHSYRRKAKTININGYDVPEPVRQPLDMGDQYYLVGHFHIYEYHHKRVWKDTSGDHYYLNLGVIQRSVADAELHTEALLSFTENKDG